MIAPAYPRIVTSQGRSPVYSYSQNGRSYPNKQVGRYSMQGPRNWNLDERRCFSDLDALFKSSVYISNNEQRLLSCDSGIAGSERSYFDCDDTSGVESNRRSSVSELSSISQNIQYGKGVSEADVPIDSTLLPWELPGIAQQLAIIQQAEYYFSDDYLSRDAYFLRQIRRKKEGYLSMKLITNFKKIRKLVRDPRVTAYCLRKSKALRVNEAGTKVKRILEVPKDLRRFQPQNSVLVIGIPERLAKIEAIMNVFYKCGDMSSVRLIRPGKDCPQEILEHLERRNDNTLWAKVNAVIEYERSEYAMAACRFLENSNNSHGIEKVCLLASGSRSKSVHPKQRRHWKTEVKSAPLSRNTRDSTKQDWKSQTPSNASNDFIEKEESNSDNAWIQQVVNHVLQQSSKTLSDHGIGSSCSESDSEKGEYSKLHSDLRSTDEDVRASMKTRQQSGSQI